MAWAWVSVIESVRIKLVCFQLAVLALFFSPRQRSLQYSTWSQFLAQLLRQVMARPHTVQGFSGKCCLFPLKPEVLGMVISNENGRVRQMTIVSLN